MELGELEFEPDDLFTERLKDKVGMDTREHVAYEVNRILREKLAKAPEVFGDTIAWGVKQPFDTHRARLVCIEEVRK